MCERLLLARDAAQLQVFALLQRLTSPRLSDSSADVQAAVMAVALNKELANVQKIFGKFLLLLQTCPPEAASTVPPSQQTDLLSYFAVVTLLNRFECFSRSASSGQAEIFTDGKDEGGDDDSVALQQLLDEISPFSSKLVCGGAGADYFMLLLLPFLNEDSALYASLLELLYPSASGSSHRSKVASREVALCVCRYSTNLSFSQREIFVRHLLGQMNKRLETNDESRPTTSPDQFARLRRLRAVGAKRHQLRILLRTAVMH